MPNSSGSTPTISSRRARTRRRVSTPTPATTAPATKSASGEKHMRLTLTPCDAGHPSAPPAKDPMPNPPRFKAGSWTQPAVLSLVDPSADPPRCPPGLLVAQGAVSIGLPRSASRSSRCRDHLRRRGHVHRRFLRDRIRLPRRSRPQGASATRFTQLRSAALLPRARSHPCSRRHRANECNGDVAIVRDLGCGHAVPRHGVRPKDPSGSRAGLPRWPSCLPGARHSPAST